MADYFEKHGYVVIPNVLTPQVCELIYIQCKMIRFYHGRHMPI